jgi:hypothetical protein
MHPCPQAAIRPPVEMQGQGNQGLQPRDTGHVRLPVVSLALAAHAVVIEVHMVELLQAVWHF